MTTAPTLLRPKYGPRTPYVDVTITPAQWRRMLDESGSNDPTAFAKQILQQLWGYRRENHQRATDAAQLAGALTHHTMAQPGDSSTATEHADEILQQLRGYKQYHTMRADDAANLATALTCFATAQADSS